MTTQTPRSRPTDLPIFAQRAAAARPQARALAGTPRPTGATPEAARDVMGRFPAPVHAVAPDAATLTGVPEPAGACSEPQVTLLNGSHELTGEAVDYTVVQQIRSGVTEAFQQNVPKGTVLVEAVHAEMVLGLIEGQIRDYSARRVHHGQVALTVDGRDVMRQAVYDALFGAGRIQPLLELEGLEDIEIEGHDNVWLVFADGRLERGPAVADSDEQLQADIQQMARTCATGEKDFSVGTKKLRMALPDGSRLAAEGFGLSHRPSVTIRKHRFIDTDLAEMQDLGTIDDGLREFLAAAIRAGLSFNISGLPASGKTTLSRAVLNALDPHVRLGTIESQYELFLHHMPTRHYRTWAAEAQPGGETGPDGQPTGRFTLVDLVELILQKNVDRIIVGEVVGEEVIAMLEAMQTGKGSLSTMHARSAWDTVERMVTLITRARGNLGTDYAQRLVAQNLDVIVHIAVVDESHLAGGRKHRFVDEVVALSLSGEAENPVTRTHLWKPGPDGRAMPTGDIPDQAGWLDQLVRHGFDEGWLTPGSATWRQPIHLLKDRRSA